MDEVNTLNIINIAYDTQNYFYDVLHGLFYCDDEFFENEFKTEINMDMFSEFCENIKITYQTFFKLNTRNEMIHMLKPYDMLKEIELFPEWIDKEHEVIVKLAGITASAIGNIVMECVTDTKIVASGPADFVWYDFENDSPEDVWNRIMNSLK